MTKLAISELKQLPKNAELRWNFLSGSSVNQHKAIFKKFVNQSLLLHVFFDGSTPEGRRWSLITNQPLHEWRGHTGGKVWLSLPEAG
jgi:hypothetical protein